MKIESDYSLLQYNTFKLPARCRWFIEYQSIDELRTILKDEYFKEQHSLHIGRGSNILFLENYPGIILHSAIKEFKILQETQEQVELYVGNGIIWDDLVALCVERNWYGAENLSLIPGEIGAAVVQNIGAYGVEIKDLVQSVHIVDISSGKEEWIEKQDCEYTYRSSIFKEKWKNTKIVVGAKLKLSKKEKYTLDYGNIEEKIKQIGKTTLSIVRQTIIAVRKNKLPDWTEYGNAGSYFMNPLVDIKQFDEMKKDYPDIPGYTAENDKIKIPAAWLIEKCGWKGKRINDVGVWPNQSLVLVNYGKATATEIALFAESIRKSVLEKFGINITPEVLYV